MLIGYCSHWLISHVDRILFILPVTLVWLESTLTTKRIGMPIISSTAQLEGLGSCPRPCTSLLPCWRISLLISPPFTLLWSFQLLHLLLVGFSYSFEVSLLSTFKVVIVFDGRDHERVWCWWFRLSSNIVIVFSLVGRLSIVLPLWGVMSWRKYFLRYNKKVKQVRRRGMT